MACSDNGNSASNSVKPTFTPDEGATTRSTDSTQQPAESRDQATLSQSVQDCCSGMSPSEYKKMTSKPTGTAENFLPSFKTENGSISRDTANEYEGQQGSGNGRSSEQDEPAAASTESTNTETAETRPSEAYDFNQSVIGESEKEPVASTESASTSTAETKTTEEYDFNQAVTGEFRKKEPVASAESASTSTAETKTTEEYDFNQAVTGESKKEQRKQAATTELASSNTETESANQYEFSQGSSANRAEVKSQSGQPGDNSAERKPYQRMSQANSERVTTDPDGNKVTEFTLDPQHRTKETRFYDNKHEATSETEFFGRRDGIVKETQFLNKKESVHKDGTKVTEYEPGDKRNPDPFIRKVTETPSRRTTSFENRPDEVTSITEYKNSKSGLEKATHYKDGSSETRYKDGTVKTRDSKGVETVSNPRMEAIAEAARRASNTTTKDDSGNVVKEFKNDPQNRTKETSFYDGKHNGALSEKEFSGRNDGIVKETQYLNRKESVHKDGTKITEYEPGDRRNPDPFIRKVVERPSYTSTSFENRPDGVTSLTEYKNQRSGLESATHYKDGSSEMRYKDGTVKTRDSKGAETVSNPRAEAEAEAAAKPVTTKDSAGNVVTEFKNDPQHRTKETHFYGSKPAGGALSETEFSGRNDGIVKETQFLNKTESVHKDGTKITEYNPGDRRNPDPFVRKITENAHRKTVTFENHPEGILTSTDYTNQPSGLEKATKYTDGRSEYRFKDGTIKSRSADGTESVRNPRAEAAAEAASKPILSKRKDAAGNEITDIKNDPEKRTRVTNFYAPGHEATQETEYSGRNDGLVKETTFLNKNEKTYSTGGKLTTYEAGDRRNPDPFVRTVWEPGSGKFKTTTYENHPDKISEMTELKNHPQGLQQQIQYTDGSTERRFQDGTVKIKPRNGPEIVRPGR